MPSVETRGSLPVLADFQQTRQTGVVAGAGVVPVLGKVDVAARHRVVVDVLDFLEHHFPG